MRKNGGIAYVCCRMFAGINDYAGVSAAPLFAHQFWQMMFWLDLDAQARSGLRSAHTDALLALLP